MVVNSGLTVHGIKPTIIANKNVSSLERYVNIVPYDHNRVVLDTPVEGCDYVNASWIGGHRSNSGTFPVKIASIILRQWFSN